MKTICFYSPYVPKHMGGGEKYLFDAVRIADIQHKYRVAVAIPNDQVPVEMSERQRFFRQVKDKYERFLDEKMPNVEFIATPLGTAASFWEKVWWTAQFDVMYVVTDGSLFFSLAKKNILHIQFPFAFPQSGIVNRLKLMNWRVKNTNSEFTKRVIQKWWKTKINYIHWPMISSSHLSWTELESKKEKVILHVGRFFRQLHSKRQDSLVEIFRHLLEQYPEQMTGWRLVLIGSVEDDVYATEVAQAAVGLPIEILHTVTRADLNHWYTRASVYWHATGFDLDEEAEPTKMEHFGISTVEAMSFGDVPVVIGKGGQPEVVGPELKQLLWKNEAECIEKTVEMVTDVTERSALAQVAMKRSMVFSPQKFQDTLFRMIES